MLTPTPTSICDLQMRTKASALQGIFESIEAKFGAEAVKNIFKQFGDFDLPTPFVETYPLLVSSDSDDTSDDDDSLGCSHHVEIL
jgi:hypothetical protein